MKNHGDFGRGEVSPAKKSETMRSVSEMLCIKKKKKGLSKYQKKIYMDLFTKKKQT